MGTTIKNSRVIVTGGANGIGSWYVRHLLLKGAKIVAILDIDIASGNESVKKLNTEFGENRVIFYPTDVSKPDQLEASFKKAVTSLDGLDIMINNAGIMDDVKWSLMIDLNIKGVVQGTLLAIDVMGKHKGGKGGTIINTASIAGLEPQKYIPIYAGTKHAVIGFTKGLAMSFEVTGVSVKAMCPGGTDTLLLRDKIHGFVEYINQDKAAEWVQSLSRQKPEIIAKEVMRLIEEAPSGAIWVNAAELSTISLNIPGCRTWGTPV